MAAESIAQDECTHPAHRVYTWFAFDDTLCAACCDCGKVLAGAAPEPDEPSETERARAEVARLELALHQLRGTGGRQRERIEVWLQGARVALAIAEREVR